MGKRTLILVMGMVLGSGVVWGTEVALTSAKLPPGTIVKIAAKRPAITLSRAQVVECTNHHLTVSHKRERFCVAESDLLDLVVLELPEPEPGTDPAAANGQSDSRSDRPGGRGKAPKSFWQKLFSFWR
jgi:hypothetical protein